MVDHGESRQQAAPQTPSRNKVSRKKLSNIQWRHKAFLVGKPPQSLLNWTNAIHENLQDQFLPEINFFFKFSPEIFFQKFFH